MTTRIFPAWTGMLPHVCHLILVYCVYCYVILHCVKNVILISHLLNMFLSVLLVQPHRLHSVWAAVYRWVQPNKLQSALTEDTNQISPQASVSLDRRHHQSSPIGSVSLDRRHQSVQPLRLQSARTGGTISSAPQVSVSRDRRHQSAWSGGSLSQVDPTDYESVWEA